MKQITKYWRHTAKKELFRMQEDMKWLKRPSVISSHRFNDLREIF